MRREFHHPKPTERELHGRKYWRSLDELAQTPGFKAHLDREFQDGASTLEGVDRRQFMKIMAASFALGGVGLAGCRRQVRHILPYGKSEAGVIPGLPVYYATSMPLRHSGIPLLAETHQGRPTKIEGNPAYALLGGVSSLQTQASLLELYDPDRAREHRHNGAKIDSAATGALLAKLGEDYAKSGGRGLAFLAGQSSSPTRARLLERLRQQLPQALWAEYEPVHSEPPLIAARAVFNQDVRPLYRMAKAKRIVSIDADFLRAEESGMYNTREFSKGRRVEQRDDPMNRLYAVESTYTLTGSMADHRLRLASSHILAFTAALARQLMGGDAPLAALAQRVEFPNKDKWLQACAEDLLQFRGECLVVAGDHQPAAVHALVYALNDFLGNIGRTVLFVPAEAEATTGIQELAATIKQGGVKTLVILGGNPVYNAPAELDWAALQKSVPQVIRHGYYEDETSAEAGTHLSSAHYLESWGDTRAVDGTILPVQPMILPLFDGLTEIEVLARILGEKDTDPHALVHATIAGLVKGNVEDMFRSFLHDGLLADSAYAPVAVTADLSRAKGLLQAAETPVPLSRENLEVRFTTDYKVDDGRFANNGWLQECPDPITKLTWDNAILISPRLAKELGVQPGGEWWKQVARVEVGTVVLNEEHAPMAEISVNGRTVRGPLHIQPGLANYTLVLQLGYGRDGNTFKGRIAPKRDVRDDFYGSYDAYQVRTSDHPSFVTGARIRLLNKTYILGAVQNHWSMEGRALVREANLEEYREHPDFVKEFSLTAEGPSIYPGASGQLTPAEKATQTPRGNSLYETPNFTDPQQWGMSIDLNTCIGCNACVVACQAENNIPIVGKDQMLRGREMHWIRIDRYYSDGKISPGYESGEGNRTIPEDPQVSLQPVACMQCENAPCEMVCPVNATVHDHQGINVMVYNRCIGTRYCANNCPYKVRRFNYFDYNKRDINELYMGPLGHDGMPDLLQMAKNPEVTVRMRGVMEKCNYCLQRVENGKIQWKTKMAKAGHPENVIVPDGMIKTACQQACPAEAIVFGDILNPENAVAKAKSREQDYALLDYLNTRPRTTYLGKLRNPNPHMPDYHAEPFSVKEHEMKQEPPAMEHYEEAHPKARAAREEGELETSILNGPSTGGLS